MQATLKSTMVKQTRRLKQLPEHEYFEAKTWSERLVMRRSYKTYKDIQINMWNKHKNKREKKEENFLENLFYFLLFSQHLIWLMNNTFQKRDLFFIFTTKKINDSEEKKIDEKNHHVPHGQRQCFFFFPFPTFCLLSLKLKHSCSL